MPFSDVYSEVDEMSCTKNEDELEVAELRLLQRQLEDQPEESQEEKDYKAEFFELLDEVKLKSLSSALLITRYIL